MPDLEALIARLAGDEALLRRSDEATRQGAVLPVLESLGWDHRNLSEVVPQVPVRDGRVSYGLGAGGRALAFVEARRAGGDPAERQRWFVEAAAGEGVPLAALTDGLAWQIYLSAEAAGIEQRLVCAADFRSDPPARAAADLRRLLDRDAVVSGAALEAAQREFDSRERDRRVRTALSEVWRRLVTQPTDPYGDTLHELLAEAVGEAAGHRPDRETVHRFLLGTLPGESAGQRRIAEESHLPAEALGTSNPAIFKGLRPAAFWLDGSRHAIRRWRDLLPRMCNLLARGAASEFVQRTDRLEGQPYLRSSAPSPHWIRIRGTGRCVYVNLTADKAVERARRVLIAVRGRRAADSFAIEPASREAPAVRSSPQSRGRQTAKGEPDYTGAQPAAFRLDGVRHEATRWRAVLAGTCELLVREAGLRRFAQAVEPIRGRTRAFFSADRSQLFMPVEIAGGEFFVEGNFSANDHVRRAREALIAVRGPQGADSFTIEPASRAAPAVRADPAVRPSIGETRASRPVRTDEDYTGKRPAAFRLDGVRHEATRWNDVLRGVCDRMAEEAGAGFGQRVADIRGQKRPYFSRDPAQLHQPFRLANSDLYVDGKFGANATVQLARRVFEAVRGPQGADSFTIELAG